MIFLDAPESCQTRRIDDLEHASFPTFPRDKIVISLLRVIQQLLKEVPEQSSI